MTFPAGTSVLSDETPYNLDHTKDLIIAFDIGDPGQGVVPLGPKVGCQAYRGANTDQAAGNSNFTAEIANQVYLVEKIEVFS